MSERVVMECMDEGRAAWRFWGRAAGWVVGISGAGCCWPPRLGLGQLLDTQPSSSVGGLASVKSGLCLGWGVRAARSGDALRLRWTGCDLTGWVGERDNQGAWGTTHVMRTFWTLRGMWIVLLGESEL